MRLEKTTTVERTRTQELQGEQLLEQAWSEKSLNPVSSEWKDLIEHPECSVEIPEKSCLRNRAKLVTQDLT